MGLSRHSNNVKETSPHADRSALFQSTRLRQARFHAEFKLETMNEHKWTELTVLVIDGSFVKLSVPRGVMPLRRREVPLP